MGGLTCAAALKNAKPDSIEINLYEAASKISGMYGTLPFRAWGAHIGQKLGRAFQYLREHGLLCDRWAWKSR